MHKYRRDQDYFDDLLHDRYTYNPSVYWTDYRFNARRYAYTDPIPNSMFDTYPAFWSRYKWYTDFLDPTFYRKYRDPNYDRPLWDSWRPYMYDRNNTKRAVKMFRQGLISFRELDKKWIEPHALGRRFRDWNEVYTPAGKFFSKLTHQLIKMNYVLARYGARRYFYSFH